MSERHYLGDYSSARLGGEGFSITPELVIQAFRLYQDLASKGLFGGDKCHSYPPPEDLWSNSDYAPFREEFASRPLEWRHNVGHAWTRFGLQVTKEIFSNQLNSKLGLPRHAATLTFREHFHGDLLLKMDGIAVSDARTTFPGLRMMECCFTGPDPINVFIFGAGRIAYWHVMVFAYAYPKKISRMTICSPVPDDGSPPTCVKLVEGIKKSIELPFALEAVTDYPEHLGEANFVLAMTNNGRPLFKKEELAPYAKTLSLSYDEMPADHIEDAVRNGHTWCDFIIGASKRGDQSLLNWFRDQGTTLADQAQNYGVQELATMEHLLPDDKKVGHCTAIGSAAQDLVLGALMAVKIAERTGRGAIADIFKQGLCDNEVSPG